MFAIIIYDSTLTQLGYDSAKGEAEPRQPALKGLGREYRFIIRVSG